MQHAFDFAMNSAIAKDLTILVCITREIIKKTFQLLIATIISMFFNQPEFSEGQLGPTRIELVPHSARNDKVPTSHPQREDTFGDPRRFRRRVLRSHGRH